MDRVLTTTVLDNQFSLTVLDTTDLVNEAIKIHGLTPVAADALGRMLTVAAYMSSCLKDENYKISITVKGNGVGGDIVVCGNGKNEIRGSVENPKANLPLKEDGKPEVGRFVGKDGKITVIKNLGLKEPYVGISDLVSGEIAEDFSAYYAYSEQIPTAMALGVKIGTDCRCICAGGVVLQVLPNASEENIEKAEKIMQSFSSLSSVLKTKPLEDIIIDSFGVDSLFYKEVNPVYKCICSKEYITSMLLTLGFEELYDILDKEGKIEVGCQFCGKNYIFEKEDIDKLKEENGRNENSQIQ